MSIRRSRTKVLVDGGDPQETVRVKGLIGLVDGQTTNPTLIARNPEVRQLISSGHKFSTKEELDEYKKIVQAISPLVVRIPGHGDQRFRSIVITIPG